VQILDPRDGVVTGDNNDNALYGHDLLNDEINGLGGNDTLIGLAGADAMYGSKGNDTYLVDNPGDKAFELVGQGTDTVLASISFALAANVENLTLTGAAPISGSGNTLANVIIGNAGANLLNGAAGNDVLAGAAGRDSFFFNTALNAATNIDKIVGFSVPQDTIRLENAVFHGLAVGTLAASAFFRGTHAHDASDRIVYNPANGALFYDSNGIAAGGAVKFAQLAAHLALTSADFFVV
jgi:Ca2+-binding RTX toxin-like protein